jgi:hypothetical protein
MVSTATTSPRRQTGQRKRPKVQNESSALNHAVRLIHAVCGLAGSPNLIEEIRADLRAEKIRAAIRNRETGPVFDWLMSAVSYQGISDQVAYGYMEKHGRATWRQIKEGLDRGASCPKLRTYWQFHDCRFDKVSRTCAEPDHIGRCPLPKFNLRNGRLNQTAYSLFLFIRDVAHGDLVGWIDRQLQDASYPVGPDRLTRLRCSLIDPLREVYGVSDKVLTMALSCILLGAATGKALWAETGGSMIAIDTLVHNFLHRSGILRRFHAHHPYGAACYRPGACAAIIDAIADRIDARQFNPAFPQPFPRFAQHAIWRYCSQNGLDVCNGNRIDDTRRCENKDCRARLMCDRVVLRNVPRR